MANEKDRVRVQAGRQGSPKTTAAGGLPAIAASPSLPAARPPATLYEAIINAARDREVDAEKMKTLVELQIQVEKWEAEKAFTRAFNALQFELPAIDKDGKIDHGEGTTARGHKKLQARYSTYPNLMGVCRPLLKKHGFTFNNVIEPSGDGARMLVVGYLRHIDGHSMKSDFPIGPDPGPGRSNAQAQGSATSYGKRYNLILMLDIVSEAPQDQDDDARKRNKTAPQGGTPEPDESPITEAQLLTLSKAIEECGVGLNRVLDKFGINDLGGMPSVFFNDAMKACSNYAEETARRTAAKTQTKTMEQRGPRDWGDDTFPGDR